MTRKERLVVEGVFDALAAAGVDVRDRASAEGAIELARKTLGYILQRQVTTDWVERKMRELIEEAT